MFRELQRQGSIFDLPARRFFPGIEDLDLAVRFHDRRAASPLGPAAGPQTQMAQNLVLSWLGGSRILELKTVQIQDQLEIPRPCIDMRTVGFNAEWSQELRLEQSRAEYVKGAFLIELLRASGEIEMQEGFEDLVYDMSVGYDLAGIQSEGVRGFIEGMKDCSALVDELRYELTDELSHLRDVEVPAELSRTLTLSTFHGCPPDEIESIIMHLMREHGLHCIVKFNPMLLGPSEARHILHDVLGYQHLRVPDSAFENDTRWDQAVEMMERLGELAHSLGLGLGAKFTNTLIVENLGDFLPSSESQVYLSGPPLHVLAVQLVDRFRRQFGDRFGVSFSAGIDRHNVADGVALGLVPVTSCTDLLKTGGYGRQTGWYRELKQRMDQVGAGSGEDFVLRAYGQALDALDRCGLAAADPRRVTCRRALEEGTDLRTAAGDELYARWREQVVVANARHYAARVIEDSRYCHESNDRPPRKIGSHLELFDCITCDKCVPVCPNDANFLLKGEGKAVPIVKLHRDGSAWRAEQRGEIPLRERHQIANFADFCNDCGNCDVFCPEDGGPYVVKPRFFGSEQAWRQAEGLDGFFVSRDGDEENVFGRFEGQEYRWTVGPERARYRTASTDLTLAGGNPNQAEGDGPECVDLTDGLIMDWLRRAVLDPAQVNYVNVLADRETGGVDSNPEQR
jgi:putative selenate reductase